MQGLVRVVITLVSVLLISYLFYCCLLFVAQRYMIFPGVQFGASAGAVLSDGAGIEKSWIELDRVKVETWFLPPVLEAGDNKPGPAIIFAHGNGEVIDQWPWEFEGFARMGIGVLLVEYPGYGRSTGIPSQHSVTETLVAAYDRLAARPDVDPSRIILMGRSLGGGAICSLAAKRPSAAIILMSTFTSIRSFASRYLVPEFLVRDPFDNLAVVGSYSGPILIIHGTRDEVIPYSHALMLGQAAKQGKLISVDAGHNDCPSDWKAFLRDVESFLRVHGILRGTA